MAKQKDIIGFLGQIARLFLDHCPDCKSLNVTKTKSVNFRAEAEFEDVTYTFKCHDCGKTWEKTKRVVKKGSIDT